MKVLFFAQCREAAGCPDYFLKVEEPVMESEFWARLVDALPGLAPHRTAARLSRHETYLPNDAWLYPGDEIAVIPPVSGG